MQKKNLLLVIFSLVVFIFLSGACYAYQTVLINFPQDKVWVKVYDKIQGKERIVQFVPSGQSYRNWTETFVFHSYRYNNPNTNAYLFLQSRAGRLEQKNNTRKYTYILRSPENSIASRCITSNQNMKAQCDIYRVAVAQEAIISIQYINKDTSSFKANYDNYLDAVVQANPYYSYFRYDRIMSRGTSFEL